MNNEIKEILDKWKCYIGLTKKFTTNDYEMLRVKDIDKLLDYITNLQKDNERLNNCIDDQERVINSLIDKRNLYKINYNDYKYRCEKASEYIKQNEFYLDYKTGACIKGVMPLLNILQNGSDSQ